MNLKLKEKLEEFVEEVNNNCKYYDITNYFFNENSNLSYYIIKLQLYINEYVILKDQTKDIENLVLPNELKSELDFINIISKKYSYFLLSKLQDKKYSKEIIKVNYNHKAEEYVAEKAVNYFPLISKEIQEFNKENNVYYLNELDIFDDKNLLDIIIEKENNLIIEK